jgi:HNH endonuclease
VKPTSEVEATDPMTSQEILFKEYIPLWLKYDPDSGKIVWIMSPNPKIRLGQRAGWLVDGWRKIKLRGATFAASRIAWLLYYGAWPTNTVDHRNRKRDDNRICNLRLATRRQQSCNRKAKGVYRVKGRKCYVASICFDGQRRHLGYFSSLKEAQTARKLAEKEIFGEFAP